LLPLHCETCPLKLAQVLVIQWIVSQMLNSLGVLWGPFPSVIHIFNLQGIHRYWEMESSVVIFCIEAERVNLLNKYTMAIRFLTEFAHHICFCELVTGEIGLSTVPFLMIYIYKVLIDMNYQIKTWQPIEVSCPFELMLSPKKKKNKMKCKDLKSFVFIWGRNCGKIASMQES
jgi:hypothetical protein